ncbi:MAG: hypothetical protein ACR2O4_08925 [Hyphomicrobiaceae bacterium]
MNAQSSRRIEIPFKGDRDYLQGPDLYNALFDFLTEQPGTTLSQIQFIAHDFIRTNSVLLQRFDDPAAIDKHTWPSFIVARIDNVVIAAAARGESENTERREEPYDEGPVRETAEIDGNTIRCRAPFACSPIEQLVSMKKYLLQTMFPEQKVKWVYARSSFATPLDAASSEMAVSCVTKAPGRIYQSNVFCDGNPAGEIYFMGMSL